MSEVEPIRPDPRILWSGEVVSRRSGEVYEVQLYRDGTWWCNHPYWSAKQAACQHVREAIRVHAGVWPPEPPLPDRFILGRKDYEAWLRDRGLLGPDQTVFDTLRSTDAGT